MLFRALIGFMVMVSTSAAFAGEVLSTKSPVEFPLETQSLVTVTTDLFDRMEAVGDTGVSPAGPLGQITPRPQQVSATLPAEVDTQLRPELGPLAGLTGYRISWYPTDTLSGAVDFVGTWGNERNLVCGYVVWDMSDPETPALAALQATYLSTSDLMTATPDRAHEMLLEANCAYGEIEPNFALSNAG